MKKMTIPLLIIASLAFIALAVYYMVTPAGSLPHGMPGYLAGSSHKHIKHSFAALALAAACGIVAWFMSGKRTDAPKNTTSEPKNRD